MADEQYNPPPFKVGDQVLCLSGWEDIHTAPFGAVLRGNFYTVDNIYKTGGVWYINGGWRAGRFIFARSPNEATQVPPGFIDLSPIRPVGPPIKAKPLKPDTGLSRAISRSRLSHSLSFIQETS